MSQNEPHEMEQAQLRFTCRTCSAPPGGWCRTASSHSAQRLHAPRYEAVMEVVRLSGYEQWVTDLEHERIQLRQKLALATDSGTRGAA